MTIVVDDDRLVNKFETSLTDDATVVNSTGHRFINNLFLVINLNITTILDDINKSVKEARLTESLVY